MRPSVLIVALPLLVAACGDTTPANNGLTRIVFVTDWKAQAEHGGFYEALAEGLYAKHGLSVVIREGYLSSEPYAIEKESGEKPQIFSLADAGYPGYANMVLVPDSWITNRPQAVQAFVDASIEGWMDYLYGDPRPGNALIKKDNP